jgi:hypothetical protein
MLLYGKRGSVGTTEHGQLLYIYLLGEWVFKARRFSRLIRNVCSWRLLGQRINSLLVSCRKLHYPYSTWVTFPWRLSTLNQSFNFCIVFYKAKKKIYVIRVTAKKIGSLGHFSFFFFLLQLFASVLSPCLRMRLKSLHRHNTQWIWHWGKTPLQELARRRACAG